MPQGKSADEVEDLVKKFNNEIEAILNAIFVFLPLNDYLQKDYSASRVPEGPVALRAPLSLRWTVTDAAATIGMPVVKGDHAVALQGGGWDLVCFDGSGSRRWRVEGRAQGCAIVNGEVVVKVKRGNDRAVLLLDLSSGAVRREEPTEGGSVAAVLSGQLGFIERGY